MDGASSRAIPQTLPSRWCLPATILAGVVGLALLVDGTGRSSAVYDEVAYLRVAAQWWRTGEQAEISRMGSPLTFWKLQQAPVLWVLDRMGRGAWIDDPARVAQHVRRAWKEVVLEG